MMRVIAARQSCLDESYNNIHARETINGACAVWPLAGVSTAAQSPPSVLNTRSTEGMSCTDD